jgi:archaetidylinositol phosphate synthase
MSHDTLIHQAVRPAVRVIATHTRITPDHLTALRLATGLGAAVSFALSGSMGWMVLGTCLFLVSALLDRADGELARQTRRFSRLGHWLDLVADCTCTAAVFVGLGLSAAGGALGKGGVVLGMMAGGGVTCIFWRVNVMKPTKLPGFAGRGGRVLADPDDAMLAVPLLLWSAGTEVVLTLAGVLAPAAALWMCLGAQLDRRRQPRDTVTQPRLPPHADAMGVAAGRDGDLAKHT